MHRIFTEDTQETCPKNTLGSGPSDKRTEEEDRSQVTFVLLCVLPVQKNKYKQKNKVSSALVGTWGEGNYISFVSPSSFKGRKKERRAGDRGREEVRKGKVAGETEGETSPLFNWLLLLGMNVMVHLQVEVHLQLGTETSPVRTAPAISLCWLCTLLAPSSCAINISCRKKRLTNGCFIHILSLETVGWKCAFVLTFVKDF